MSRPDRLPVRDSLALMSGYHSPQLDVAVRLNTNESPVPPPDDWAESLRAAQAEIDWHRYPDRGAHELRAALAKHERVAPEQVFAANGSNEVLQCLLLAFGGPGRTALTFEPTYALHSHIARLAATEVIAGERLDDFSLDASYASAMVAEHRPAITFLCSPNNPTGMVEPPELVERLLADVAALPGLLLMDEAYGQFDPTQRWTWWTRADRWRWPAPTPKRGRWLPLGSAIWSPRRGWWLNSTRRRCRTTSTPSSRSPDDSP